MTQTRGGSHTVETTFLELTFNVRAAPANLQSRGKWEREKVWSVSRRM